MQERNRSNVKVAMVFFYVGLLFEIATVIATLLLAPAPRSFLVWVAMGFLNWSEFLLFAFAIWSSLSKLDGAVKAIIGSSLGSYCLVGLITIIVYGSVTRFVAEEAEAGLYPLIAYLLIETVITLGIVLILPRKAQFLAENETAVTAVTIETNEICRKITELKIKFPVLRQRLPESLENLAKLEKIMDLISTRLTHGGVKRVDESVSLAMTNTMNLINQSMDQLSSKDSNSHDLITVLEAQITQMDNLTRKLVS